MPTAVQFCLFFMQLVNSSHTDLCFLLPARLFPSLFFVNIVFEAAVDLISSDLWL